MTPTEEIRQIQQEFEVMQEQGRLTAEAAQALSSRASDLVIAHHLGGGGLLREAVDLLCRMATHSDRDTARAGVRALFPELIERLNDSFDPANCALYDQLFAQLIEFSRRLPDGRLLDEELRRFGLPDENALFARKARVLTFKAPVAVPVSVRAVKKVLLLSRVTIGADVAVTSVMISKLRQVAPGAEFVILGSRKLRELYGGDDRIRIREIAYERGGNLLARLNSWLEVVSVVQEERQGSSEVEVWVIDPDSRLTQLGLLPLVENDRDYFFFESRGYRADTARSIGQLAADWAGELTGNHDPAFPFVALPANHQEFGRRVVNGLRAAASGRRRVVAVSFGVGGNPRKRIPDPFEEDLIERLLADSKIILDKGAGGDEREQVNRITAQVRGQGRGILELSEANKAELAFLDWARIDLVTWDGGIGAFAGLIAASDEYVGYDSAGQHLAAALGVPTLTVLVNSNGERFASRWRPFGRGKIDVVRIEAVELAARPDCATAVLSRVMGWHQRNE